MSVVNFTEVLKKHCIICQLDNKLLINLLRKRRLKVFKRPQWKSNLQQDPYKHSTCLPRRKNAETMF